MAEATLQEVTVTTRVKTKEEILNEKYASGLFNAGPTRQEYIFDMNNLRAKSFSNILDYLTGMVPNLRIVYQKFGDYLLEWRGEGHPEFFLNQLHISQEEAVHYPMSEIAMIKLFPPLFMFSTGGGRGGAIVIYSKIGGDNVYDADTKDRAQVKLVGYSQFREFYNPPYEQPAAGYTKPDNRTTLYWNPYVITNKIQQRMQVEFYNNDFTKTFNVVLEGVNAAGKMTRVVRTIDANTKVE
jgi:hypothetical protein